MRAPTCLLGDRQMRFSIKSSLAVLAVYFLVLGAVALLMERRLRAVSDSLFGDTARLVGREVGAALSGPALDQLLHFDPAMSTKLIDLVNEATARSQVVTSLVVVDRNGTVIAGDKEQLGKQVTLPELVFGGETHTRFVPVGGGMRGAESYVFVPLLQDDRPIGYLRLLVRNERLARLYREARTQLLVTALVGLLVVVALGFVFQTYLSRAAAQLTRTLEGALRGEPVGLPRRPDELGQAFEAARQVGLELHAAREKTSQAQRRLNSLMQVMDVGVLLLNPSKGLDFASARARELLGCADVQTLEARWNALRPELDGRLERCSPLGTQVDVPVPRDGTGTRLRLELYPLREEDIQGYVVVLKSRDTIEALENELRLAIQMRGFAGFYMAFAHDLKAPLNAMVMNVELLRESLRNGHGDATEVDAKRRRYLAVLQEEIARLDRYLHTLLTQAALPSAAEQQFDLRDLIADLATLLGPQARQQRVALNTTVPDAAVPFMGHRDRLKQALLNIAINALEALPDGGEIAITLEAAGDTARLAVRDTGPGIPAEILEDVYSMHFTTKDGGTGIGLYVARSVVESHNGQIRVASVPGDGTRFEIALPLPPTA